jgi:hypothetical protein
LSSNHNTSKSTITDRDTAGKIRDASSRTWEFLALSEAEMRKKLAALRVEHRDLDAAIDALTQSGSQDQLQIARLKKRKLGLRDQIAIIEDYLTPDIIA